MDHDELSGARRGEYPRLERSETRHEILVTIPDVGNRNFVKHRDFSQATGSVQFTIREWFSPKRLGVHLLGLLGTVALLVVLGPFGTWDNLAVADRLAFWAITVGVNWIVAYAFAYVVFNLTIRAFGSRTRTLWAGLLLASVIAALPGTGAVWLAVATYLDHRPTDAFGVIELYLKVAVLNVSIGAIVFLLTRRARMRVRLEVESPPEVESSPPERSTDTAASHDAHGRGAHDAAVEPALLARLPAESRGALLHLRMQDHYVEVHTAVGMALLLMRFRDALREVEDADGLRVHRSHWVARAAVVGVERRRGGSFVLRLVNGNEVPVSRSFAPTLKDQGWV